jgi:hypothetical protein
MSRLTIALRRIERPTNTPSRAALLAVPIGEDCAFVSNAVDVGGRVTHHSVAVGTDVPIADVIDISSPARKILSGTSRIRLTVFLDEVINVLIAADAAPGD